MAFRGCLVGIIAKKPYFPKPVSPYFLVRGFNSLFVSPPLLSKFLIFCNFRHGMVHCPTGNAKEIGFPNYTRDGSISLLLATEGLTPARYQRH